MNILFPDVILTLKLAFKNSGRTKIAQEDMSLNLNMSKYLDMLWHLLFTRSRDMDAPPIRRLSSQRD